jgi:hypothetical protein
VLPREEEPRLLALRSMLEFEEPLKLPLRVPDEER